MFRLVELDLDGVGSLGPGRLPRTASTPTIIRNEEQRTRRFMVGGLLVQSTLSAPWAASVQIIGESTYFSPYTCAGDCFAGVTKPPNTMKANMLRTCRSALAMGAVIIAPAACDCLECPKCMDCPECPTTGPSSPEQSRTLAPGALVVERMSRSGVGAVAL